MAENKHNSNVYNLSLFWSGVSSKGEIRERNEDTFVALSPLALSPEYRSGLFVVSDGIGGHPGGEAASQIVSEKLPEIVRDSAARLKGQSIRAFRDMLRRAVLELNGLVLSSGLSGRGVAGMGATVVAVLVKGGRCFMVNVGDSRFYLLRNGRLLQKSRDHSGAALLARNGLIKSEEIQNHPEYNLLTKYIGMEDTIEPFVRTFRLKRADRLLLCTDGLTDLVAEMRIKDIMRENKECGRCCKLLVEAANSAGGFDNVTVIVIDISGPG